MYSVKEIYYTLQGEGAQTGRAAVFCRFAGCNLWSGREADRASAICRFCDTDFADTNGPGGGKFASAEELATTIETAWSIRAIPGLSIETWGTQLCCGVGTASPKDRTAGPLRLRSGQAFAPHPIDEDLSMGTPASRALTLRAFHLSFSAATTDDSICGKDDLHRLSSRRCEHRLFAGLLVSHSTPQPCSCQRCGFRIREAGRISSAEKPRGSTAR